jgi:hypothetical protein
MSLLISGSPPREMENLFALITTPSSHSESYAFD